MTGDEERIAAYRAERDQALETVRKIDEDKWRFSAAQGGEVMRDVTDERRADSLRLADLMDTLIGFREQRRDP